MRSFGLRQAERARTRTGAALKDSLKGKRVAVVGMGASGVAAASLLVREGAQVLVTDDRPKEIPSALSDLSQEAPGKGTLRFQLGGRREEDLLSSDLIVLSPGVPLKTLPVEKLQARRIPIIGEIELASTFLAALTAPIIAITGTNGKSTTTTLVGEILKGWGWKVFVGGNLGTPLSEAISGRWDFIVAELSSFQLETIRTFRPRIAALLNVTPDHLDRYPDFQSYQEAKWRLFENQGEGDYAVVNQDDPATMPPALKGSAVSFSRLAIPKRGVYLHWREGEIVSNLWGEPETIIRVETLKIKGSHNLENAMAAIAVTLLCGCSAEGIRQTLVNFKGLPHRMEFVREVRGIKYVNDSKGTNVGAVIKSLEGLTVPVVLIAGGKDKESDFTPLKELIHKKVKRLILLGEAQEKIARCFSDHPAVERVGSMEQAVERAAAAAEAGEIVLLSPGCASFDMFRDYRHRGEVFKQAVEGLPS
ncbi:MAG: UDP-N-acetylmuramoyl-L-alanine--D-glutamate ligase [Candidatus Manganitrophaceae bacterium]|nr:MAG: UDP-N-acetylmuramoyl-L-alanine--D-glutamate ligase [Candidatus Manganitrophaceae bacterium]